MPRILQVVFGVGLGRWQWQLLSIGHKCQDMVLIQKEDSIIFEMYWDAVVFQDNSVCYIDSW